MILEIEIEDEPSTYLYIDVKKFSGGGWSWIIASALVLFCVLRLTLEMTQDPSLTII